MTSPPDFEFLRIERTDDDVVIATLDRPKVNALDTALLLEIGELAGALHAEPPGALVLTGGGRHFAAGADLTGFAGPPLRPGPVNGPPGPNVRANRPPPFQAPPPPRPPETPPSPPPPPLL